MGMTAGSCSAVMPLWCSDSVPMDCTWTARRCCLPPIVLFPSGICCPLHGQAIGADLAVLSPIRVTKAHPDIVPLGWEGLEEIASRLQIPVYALGGVDAEDEPKAVRAGAQGIAGNRGYWKG